MESWRLLREEPSSFSDAKEMAASCKLERSPGNKCWPQCFLRRANGISSISVHWRLRGEGRSTGEGEGGELFFLK